MRPFWAIVKLTCRNVLRSHIFQLLLLILIMCVAFIPATIQGDGTARLTAPGTATNSAAEQRTPAAA